MNRYHSILNRRLLKPAVNSDLLIVTGDITTGLHTEEHLKFLAETAKKVCFVLGNHDFYTSSFQEISFRVKKLLSEYPNLVWLEESLPMEFSSGKYLLGIDGWYDGVHGDSIFMDINIDRMMIKDLLLKRKHEERVNLNFSKAVDSAKKFLSKMKEVPEDAEEVIIATHYPPWMGPITSIFDAFWLPQSVNTALSESIMAVASQRPSTKFRILCGHVHRTYDLQVSENVFCSILDARQIREFFY